MTDEDDMIANLLLTLRLGRISAVRRGLASWLADRLVAPAHCGALAFLAVAASAISTPVHAQNYECPEVGEVRTVYADDEACMQRIANGVYVIIHRAATNEWPHSNTGVIEGRRSLFVIDSTYLPSRARADIEIMQRIIGKPVSYLSTTHWHMDHNFGASAYAEAFPNLVYLAETATARLMELNQTWYSRMSVRDGSERLRALAELEDQVRRGVDESGADLPADRVEFLRDVRLPRRRNELEELRTLRVVQPTRLFDGALRLNFEGRRIEIKNWGRANSPSDTTFYLPRERVLFAGDIVVQSPTPYLCCSYPLQWIDVLAGLGDYEVLALAPGHGPTLAGSDYVGNVRTLLERITAYVERSLRAGLTEDQSRDGLDAESLRDGIAVWRDEVVPAEDWSIYMHEFHARVWQNVRGQEN